MKSTHTNTNTNKYKNQLKEKVFTYHKVAEKNKIKEELEEVPGKLSPHPQIPKGNYKQVQTKDRTKISGSKKKRGNTGELFGQKKCFFRTKHGWTSKTNILNQFLDMYL